MLDDNANETSGYICHSHDFCDANMAMYEAFEHLGLKTNIDCEGWEEWSEWDSTSSSVRGELTVSPENVAKIQAATALWNEAWDMAKVMFLTRKGVLTAIDRAAVRRLMDERNWNARKAREEYLKTAGTPLQRYTQVLKNTDREGTK